MIWKWKKRNQKYILDELFQQNAKSEW